MIRNKEELLAASAEWARVAKDDIREKMIGFMEASRLNQAQLSDLLGMTMGEIEQVLQGNGEITLTTFAKLLIASGHVLEIKPLEVSRLGANMPRMNGNTQPRDSRGRFMPRNGRMTPPPFNGMMPPMGEMIDGFPMPNDRNGMMPPPNHMRRFGGMPGINRRRMEQGMPMPPQGMPMPPHCAENPFEETQREPSTEVTHFDAIDRRGLVNIIRENGWDGQIDLVNSTRSEMIDFLVSKENEAIPQEEVRPQSNELMTKNEEIAQMLAKELERNPHLRDVIARYV